MHTNALIHNRKCVVSQVAQWCDGLLRQPLTWTQWALNGSSRDPWQLLLFKPDRKTFRNTRTLHTHTHAHTYLTRTHTNGFGRNIKDHIDFTGQSRSSPPWGLWEANETRVIVKVIWVWFSKGLEQSGAVMQTAPVYSPSTRRFHPQKLDAAVRGEPLALEEAEKTKRWHSCDFSE